MVDRVGQQIGNYRLVRLLGQGGFADVYLGEHIHLNTKVAIKILRTQLASNDIEQFRQEARAVAHLQHPHIVYVFDFGVEGTIPYLIMSYAPHGTMRQRYPKGTQLPLSLVVTYVNQAAAALQYAHDRKLIHRDIKPENLLVGYNNEVLLSDFGIAIVAQSSRHQSTKDMAGTVAYMAPEQIAAYPRPASDQYSLGIIVYEWLTGDLPFRGSFMEIAAKHSLVPPPPLREKLPNISPSVEQVVMTALAKDPKDRFGSIRAFATALEQSSQVTRSASSDLSTVAKLPNQTPLPMEAAKSSPRTAWTLKTLSLIGLALILLISANIGVVGYQNYVNQVNQGLFNTSTSTFPTIVDPLSDNSKGSQWDEGQGCVFKGGGYHVINAQSTSFQACMAHKSNFGNFIYQVQMTIIKGSYGCLIFRSDDTASNFYAFCVGQDGVYSFVIHKGGTNTEVRHGPSPTFKQGPNQTNLITVFAQGTHLIFYVNAQYVYDTNDTTFNSGEIGLITGSIGSPSEVVYINAKVWTL